MNSRNAQTQYDVWEVWKDDIGNICGFDRTYDCQTPSEDMHPIARAYVPQYLAQCKRYVHSDTARVYYMMQQNVTDDETVAFLKALVDKRTQKYDFNE